MCIHRYVLICTVCICTTNFFKELDNWTCFTRMSRACYVKGTLVFSMWVEKVQGVFINRKYSFIPEAIQNFPGLLERLVFFNRFHFI